MLRGGSGIGHASSCFRRSKMCTRRTMRSSTTCLTATTSMATDRTRSRGLVASLPRWRTRVEACPGHSSAPVASGRVRTRLWGAPVVLCATADFHHPRPRPPRPPSHIAHLVMFGHDTTTTTTCTCPCPVHVVVLIEVHAVVHRRNKVLADLRPRSEAVHRTNPGS